MGDMAKTSGRRLRRGVALSVAGLVAAPALVLGSGTAAQAALDAQRHLIAAAQSDLTPLQDHAADTADAVTAKQEEISAARLALVALEDDAEPPGLWSDGVFFPL